MLLCLSRMDRDTLCESNMTKLNLELSDFCNYINVPVYLTKMVEVQVSYMVDNVTLMEGVAWTCNENEGNCIPITSVHSTQCTAKYTITQKKQNHFIFKFIKLSKRRLYRHVYV